MNDSNFDPKDILDALAFAEDRVKELRLEADDFASLLADIARLRATQPTTDATSLELLSAGMQLESLLRLGWDRDGIPF